MRTFKQDDRRQQWLAYSQKLRTDPSLVAYYTFEQHTGGPSLLPNQSTLGNVLDARVEFVPVREPLSVWNREENRPRITNSPDWRYAYTWIKANKHLVTPRAFVSFLMTWVSASASRQGDWRALFMLLRESYGTAAPSAMDQLIFWSNWLLPRGLRNRISAVFSKSHRSGAGHLMRR